jgi:hypothetical protein
MSGKRASIFDAESELDVSGFVPTEAIRPNVGAEQVKAVSEAANFQSREPPQRETMTASPKREPRRYRTGRNIQLNVKARAETIDAFYGIADREGWVLGETFERAVAALERELAGSV